MIKETAASVLSEIDTLYDRWSKLYKDGGSDPFWPDGSGLWMIRNQIIHAKERLEKFTVQENSEGQICLFAVPEIVDARPLPPEVPRDYMAKPEKIRREAEEVANRLETNPMILYLQNIALDDTTILPTRISMGYYKNIARIRRSAIEKDNLVEMRRGKCYPADIETALRGIISSSLYFAGKKEKCLDYTIDINEQFVSNLKSAKTPEEIKHLVDQWVQANNITENNI